MLERRALLGREVLRLVGVQVHRLLSRLERLPPVIPLLVGEPLQLIDAWLLLRVDPLAEVEVVLRGVVAELGGAIAGCGDWLIVGGGGRTRFRAYDTLLRLNERAMCSAEVAVDQPLQVGLP